MLKLELCKEILNKKGKKYSDQQVEQLSRFVAVLADVWVNCTTNKIKKNEQKGSYLHKSIDRSAS
jgi:hypothetical protein